MPCCMTFFSTLLLLIVLLPRGCSSAVGLSQTLLENDSWQDDCGGSFEGKGHGSSMSDDILQFHVKPRCSITQGIPMARFFSFAASSSPIGTPQLVVDADTEMLFLFSYKARFNIIGINTGESMEAKRQCIITELVGFMGSQMCLPMIVNDSWVEEEIAMMFKPFYEDPADTVILNLTGYIFDTTSSRPLFVTDNDNTVMSVKDVSLKYFPVPPKFDLNEYHPRLHAVDNAHVHKQGSTMNNKGANDRNNNVDIDMCRLASTAHQAVLCRLVVSNSTTASLDAKKKKEEKRKKNKKKSEDPHDELESNSNNNKVVEEELSINKAGEILLLGILREEEDTAQPVPAHVVATSSGENTDSNNNNNNSDHLSADSDDRKKQNSIIDDVVSNSRLQQQGVFCGIYTTASAHDTKLKAITSTWGRKCSGFLAFSTVTNYSIPAVRIPILGSESYNNMWQKAKSIWKYVHENYIDDFEWFLLGGDDMYYVMENLFEFLLSDDIQIEKQKGNGVYLGRPLFRVFIDNKTGDKRHLFFNSGGAGYILDRVALQTLVRNLRNPLLQDHCLPYNTATYAEDLIVGKCLNASNTRIQPFPRTKDSLGRERFHMFTPEVCHDPNSLLSSSQLNVYKFSDADFKTGVDCCSPSSVSFHNVSAELMYDLDNMLYKCTRKSTLCKFTDVY